ncbi:MAG TPA: hypothetical protein EYH22_00875 [Candidatus Nanopusillus sp.]|nr:hypothetical protein [Candidatus Nanopusillus sp.]
MNTLLEEYKVWLEIQGRSKNTIKTYTGVIKRFLQFLRDTLGVDLDQTILQTYMNKDLIFKFLAKSKLERKLDLNSLRLYTRAITSFLKFLGLEDLAKQIKAPKVDKRLPKFITFEEFQKLVNAAKKDRDKLIIEFLFYTGVRVSELVSLKKDAILWDQGFIRVYGKGGKERLVPIPEFLLKKLRDYVNKINSEYIFPLSARQVERIVKNTAIRAGITKKVTPHVLRHSLATTLLSKGVDIRYIQELLGHSSLSVTQVYTHVVPSKLKEIYKKIFV